MKIIIDEKTVENARDCLRYEEIRTFLDETAPGCFERLQIQSGSGDEWGTLPPMYKENSTMKQRYLLGALAKLYLGIPVEMEDGEKDAWLISTAAYDQLREAHLLNQLERLKSHGSIRDKVFDLLADYRELEKKLNTEVYGLLKAMNDPVSRAAAFLRQAAPETAKAALREELEKLEALRERRAEAGNGDE